MIGAIFVQIGGEMKKILVTGFDPFGGEKVNPALEVIKLLPKKIGENEVRILEIPTVYKKISRKNRKGN